MKVSVHNYNFRKLATLKMEKPRLAVYFTGKQRRLAERNQEQIFWKKRFISDIKSDFIFINLAD